jgi:hypothetical protein
MRLAANQYQLLTISGDMADEFIAAAIKMELGDRLVAEGL